MIEVSSHSPVWTATNPTMATAVLFSVCLFYLWWGKYRDEDVSQAIGIILQARDTQL